MAERQPDDAHQTLTAVLEQISPFWSWVRANFTMPAVLAIAGILISASSYIVSLKTRVVVLEHEVVHITKIVPDTTALAAMGQRVTDHEERITRLESDWDNAQQFAALPPRPRWRRVRHP